MYMTKTHTTKIWILSRTEMYMTKSHTTKIWIISRTEMYIPKTHTTIRLIVIRTNMYMTKTHTKTYVNMDIQSTILYMTKHTIELISTRKMMKFHYIKND